MRQIAIAICAGRRADTGDGIEVGHVLIVSQAGEDLLQVVPAHERVVFGELPVQGLDQHRDLAAGPADGKFGQGLGVAPAIDERTRDAPCRWPL